MIGAIIGDVVGSTYEFHNIKTKDFPLFGAESFFTDDTVMTVAVAEALLKGGTADGFIDSMKKWGRLYPDLSYGTNFRHWLMSDDRRPYGSFGNGSAMRVSPCAWFARSLEEAEELAEKSAAVTHDHPEGIKGARATAAAIWLARTESKQKIKEYIEGKYGYDLSRRLDDIRPSYRFDETCQGTVPEAIIAFLESDGFEDAIRNAVSLGGDSDTLAAITGGIAEACYGVPPGALWTVFRCLRHDYPFKGYPFTYDNDHSEDLVSVIVRAWHGGDGATEKESGGGESARGESEAAAKKLDGSDVGKPLEVPQTKKQKPQGGEIFPPFLFPLEVPQTKKQKPQVVIEIGAEGGSLSWERMKIGGVHKYRCHHVECMGEFDDQIDNIDRRGGWISDLGLAMASHHFGNQWPMLHLIRLAPEVEEEFLRVVEPHGWILQQYLEARYCFSFREYEDHRIRRMDVLTLKKLVGTLIRIANTRPWSNHRLWDEKLRRSFTTDRCILDEYGDAGTAEELIIQSGQRLLDDWLRFVGEERGLKDHERDIARQLRRQLSDAFGALETERY